MGTDLLTTHQVQPTVGLQFIGEDDRGCPEARLEVAVAYYLQEKESYCAAGQYGREPTGQEAQGAPGEQSG